MIELGSKAKLGIIISSLLNEGIEGLNKFSTHFLEATQKGLFMVLYRLQAAIQKVKLHFYLLMLLFV